MSAQFDVVKGSDALDPSTGAPLADQSEYNYTLDYKPGSGPLEGLWLRARYAQVREDGRGKVDDQLRIIINYSIPFL